MIEPTDRDIGRRVIYRGTIPGKPEQGYITSFNHIAVFIRYGDDKHSKATRRQDLEWLPASTVLALGAAYLAIALMLAILVGT